MGVSGTPTAQINSNNYNIQLKKKIPYGEAIYELNVCEELLLTDIHVNAEQQLASTRDSNSVSRIRGVASEQEGVFHTHLTHRPTKTSPQHSVK